jgi:phosphonoacetaldehyde hydrolase
MAVTAVIFDWAGTTVDYGSLAPVRTLQRLFAARGVPLAEEDARRDMGIPKKEHIRALLRATTQREPGETEVQDWYAAFIPMQMECLADYSTLIPGIAAAAARLRARGIKIGSSTGYTRPMVEVLLERAAAQGYTPDCAVCPEDAGGGRPWPWMCYLNAIRLQAYPLHTMIKVGDTESDIREGLNAGMWTVGVSRTGNAIGLTAGDFAALPAAAQSARLASAQRRLHDAGAHYVIDSAAHLEALLEPIEQRIRNGERP